MALLFGALCVATVIVRSFMRNVTKTIPAAEVEAADRRWLAQAQAARPIPREQEESGLNQGRAKIFASRRRSTHDRRPLARRCCMPG